jgi:hypothetical protein
VGTKEHFESIMQLTKSCQIAREESRTAKLGCVRSGLKEVEEEMGTTAAGAEAARRVLSGAAYVTGDHAPLTPDEMSWHIRMMARAANLRSHRSKVIKNTYKQGAPVRYGTLLDRSINIIHKAPAATHSYMETQAGHLLRREFGGKGACSLPCCYSGMCALHRPDDHKTYSQEVP